MRHKGKITNWNDDKGFGFIAPKRGGKEVFVHIKSFTNRQRRPLENEVVTYRFTVDDNGRPQAEKIMFRWDRMRSLISFTHRNIALILTLAYFIFLGAAAYVGKLPFAILWFYLGVSAATFVAYALDKSAAKKDKWRTKESTLHLLALIGGWPGALSAQRLIHHKSRKRSFQITFWMTVVLNCGALGGLFTSFGSKILHSILGAA